MKPPSHPASASRHRLREGCMSEREPKFWTCDPDAETLYFTEIGEAVYDWCDGWAPEQPPETVVVIGYDPEEKAAAGEGRQWVAGGGPNANGMRFCPYCGARLVEVRYTEPAA